MALRSGGVPNLHQGVSQQPDPLRDATQGKLQVNGVSSPADGLRKREGSEALAKISTTAAPFDSVAFHHIQRDGDNQYLAVISRTQVRIFKLDGTELPVTMAAGAAAYLGQAVDASYDLRAVTVADFTYLTNLRVAPAMNTMRAPAQPRPALHEALIWVKAANYGQVYDLTINGITATVETAVTPTSVVDGEVVANRISAEQIAEKLTRAIAGGTVTSIRLTGGKPTALANVANVRVNNTTTTTVTEVKTLTNGKGTSLYATITLSAGLITGINWVYDTKGNYRTNGFEPGDKIYARVGDLTGEPDDERVHIATVTTTSGPFATRVGWTNNVRVFVFGDRDLFANLYRDPVDGYISQIEIVSGYAGKQCVVDEALYVAQDSLINDGSSTVLVFVGRVQAVSGQLLQNAQLRREGAVIHATSANQIIINAKDGKSNDDITAITNSVQVFTELPRIAPVGYQVEVIGDKANKNDSYYVNFVPGEGKGLFGEGVWEECPAPGVTYRINPQTMPHLLVRSPNGDGFWFGAALLPGTVQPITGVTLPSWGDRTCGDYESNPDPSFIGQPINDLFVHKNRLCFLTGENMSTSRADKHYDFFRETVTTAVDSDPIDLLASQDRISVLSYAQPQQNEILLFSQQLQFLFASDEAALTAASARVAVLTSYECDLGCRPVAMAGSVLFAVANGEWTQVREFRTYGAGGNSVSAEAPEITEHVRNYVPAQLRQMVVNEAGNILIARSSKPCFRDRLYVYKYYNQAEGGGYKRAQSSWSYWNFCVDEILSVLIFNQKLYMVTRYGEEVWLEQMSVADRPEKRYAGEDSDGDTLVLPHEIYLDRRITSTGRTPELIRVSPGVYDPITDTTTWTLPYSIRCKTQVWTAYGGSIPCPPQSTVQIIATDPTAMAPPPVSQSSLPEEESVVIPYAQLTGLEPGLESAYRVGAMEFVFEGGGYDSDLQEGTLTITRSGDVYTLHSDGFKTTEVFATIGHSWFASVVNFVKEISMVTSSVGLVTGTSGGVTNAGPPPSGYYGTLPTPSDFNSYFNVLLGEPPPPFDIVYTLSDSPSDPGEFTISRSGPTTQPLTVEVEITGTAINGSNYTTLASSYVLGVGESSKAITVDPLPWLNQSFNGSATVVMTVVPRPAYGLGESGSAVVTIGGPQPVVVAQAIDPTASESGSAGAGTFRVSRSDTATVGDLVVALGVSGTATSGTDYSPLPGSVTIPNGEVYVDIVVAPLPDGLAEGSETVILTVLPGPGYRVGSFPSATITIANAT
jgi:hypothetical protein